jgi:Uma2 family endonuclease
MATTKLVTVEELEQMPDDGNHYDLIRGELICMSPTGEHHGEIVATIAAHLWLHARASGTGKVLGAETGFVLARNPDVLLGPDASFVRFDRLDPARDRAGFLQLAPDLAVEVISPSDRAGHISAKVMEYLDAGVRILWLVDPRRQIVTVYTPDRTARIFGVEEVLDGGDVLPGFSLTIAEIFA